MFRLTTACLFSKRITIPQLSPTHTRGRLVRWIARVGQQVQAYDEVFLLQCSSDFVTEAHRETPNETKLMVVDTQDEGMLRDLRPPAVTSLTGGETNLEEDPDWLPVGTEIGIIDDGDEVDGDWIWQAYLYNNENSKEVNKTP